MIIILPHRTIPFESVVLQVEPERIGSGYELNAYIGSQKFAVAGNLTYCTATKLMNDILKAYQRGKKTYEI